MLLGGCTTLDTQNLSPVSVTNIEQAKNWELQGKIAFKSEQEKFTTNLYWFHHLKGNELKLTTMIGTNVLTLSETLNKVTLEVDGKTYQDTDAQALLANVSGLDIPINKLPLWITGQKHADDQVLNYNAQGQIKRLESPSDNAPWQVEFISWQPQSGVSVPRQIKVTRQDVQIKIQVNQWQALSNI